MTRGLIVALPRPHSLLDHERLHASKRHSIVQYRMHTLRPGAEYLSLIPLGWNMRRSSARSPSMSLIWVPDSQRPPPAQIPILVLARLLELGTGTFSVTREYPHRNPMRLHDIAFMICSVRIDGANGPRWKSDYVLLTSHS